MAKIKLGFKALLDKAMTVQAQGNATAIGEDTAANVSVESHTIDRGKVTLTFGKVTATASGTAETGGAYATAQTSATVAGADLGHSLTKTTSGSGSDWASATSVTRFFAIDVKGFEFKNGHIVSTSLPEKTVTTSPQVPAGNTATLGMDATATGDYSVVKAEASVIATDSFSDVAASVVSSADGHSDYHLFG
ncbi:hypothetical protein [Belnapia sp. F-4-1]|uniref:hypothetical protein n=1 Tax=Belnapia sp. F-4-1 TaxID=1545443 RepID=UPI0005BC5144|nr:hypothetical protein [Belnapia sp. F-4-1]